MRLLPERANPDGEGDAGQESASYGRANPRNHEQHALPLYVLQPDSGGHQTRRQNARRRSSGCGQSGARGRRMSTSSIPRQVEEVLSMHRRGFLKTAGLLFVGFAAPPAPAADPPGPYPIVDPRKLDSWIVIHENNTATFYVGKTDPGQGTGTGFRQLMSDELDMAFEKTTCIMGSTDITVDQVGSGGSTAMERDSWPMRRVAAEGRRVLLEMASARLDVPVDRLNVREGVITVTSDPSRRVSYGQLIGGKRFNVALTGNNINAIAGLAKVKPVQALRNVGQSPPR